MQTRPPRLSPAERDDGGQVFALAETLEARDKPLPYVGQSLVDCRRARAGRYPQIIILLALYI